MKKIPPSTMPIILSLLAAVLILNSCATAGEKTAMAMEDLPLTGDVTEGAPAQAQADEMDRGEKAKTEKPFPFLLFQSGPGDMVTSPVSGKVITTGENEFGNFVIIETNRN